MDDATKESLLDQFREYLETIDTVPDPATETPGDDSTDLFSVFVELAALRNEVRTESRLVKDALDRFRDVFDTLRSAHATLERDLQHAHADRRDRDQALLRPLLLELLDLRDRLDAALQPSPAPSPAGWLGRWRRKPAALESWQEGLGITARRLDRILADRRVLRLDLLGKDFDPRLARVVGTTTGEGVAAGRVVAEARAGYLWDDDLLRTAEVIVSKADRGDSDS